MLLFEDECLFQQAGTIVRTWAEVGVGTKVASKPVRRSVKTFGALRIDKDEPKFHYKFGKDKFNSQTFEKFINCLVNYYQKRNKKIHLIVDNAAFHKRSEAWKSERKHEIELHYLPPYSPDLNPVEWVWQKTKRAATHNRFFNTLNDLREAVSRRFLRYHGNPKTLSGMVANWV